MTNLPVHADGSKREHRHVNRHRLDEVHQVAHEPAEHPAMRVESVGQSEGDARGAHQHVRESQISNEEVDDVVHLARAAYHIEEEVIAKDAYDGHKGVAGYYKQLE